jgi:hypothetical protein
LQAIAKSGKAFSPCLGAHTGVPRGDISTVLAIMHEIRSLAPISNREKELQKFVSDWCRMKGLDDHSRCLFAAIWEFKEMELYMCPPIPAIGSDHRKLSVLFSRVPSTKTSFDAPPKVYFNQFCQHIY